MPPKANNQRPGKKRNRESPVKGTDRCAACDNSLDESSSAMQCDECEKWLCIGCLDMTLPEYDLFTKMTNRVACEWFCPPCKHSAKDGNSDVKTIVMNCFSSFKADMKTEFDALKLELKSDMKAAMDKINMKVTKLEQDLETKCSVSDVTATVDAVVAQQLAVLRAEMEEDFEERVNQVLRADRDRMKRSNNLVAYGIPPQNNDQEYIRQYLTSNYGLQSVNISNVKRLAPSQNQNSNSAPANPTHQIPILFTVANAQIKKQILQVSYEKKETIQFRSDLSKQDRQKRNILLEKLRERTANGETNLVIRSGKIVTKNAEKGLGGPAPQPVPYPQAQAQAQEGQAPVPMIQ